MPVPRRCPACGGSFNYRTGLYEHWNDCPDPVQPGYPEDEQDRDALELRGEELAVDRLLTAYDVQHPEDHDCEECENARRAALVEAYPWLGRYGLSPKTEVGDL